jgi:60 kDa SS-A/Ro ribonucleoprotein
MKYNKRISDLTVNLAGGQAYSESPKLEFVSLLLTSFVKDQFYRSENESVERVRELLDQIDPLFAAKTALYARTKYGMRSISHVVAGEIAKKARGQKWTRNFFDKVIYRPDDMGEILGYYFTTEKKLSNPLRDGFARALTRFDEYQLGKYRGEGSAYKLVDIVNLCHPKSTEALKKLIEGKLKSKDTWETELTKAGQQAETDEQKDELKAAAWKKLIKEKKIGYFALLRNLRNIIEQSPDVLPDALALLTDEHLIRKSLVLPFRFLTAIEQIEQINGNGVRDTLIALAKAIDIALGNVPRLEGKTLVVLDTSGSMEGQPIKIGSVFASTLFKANDADLMIFSDDAQYLTLNPLDSTLTLANRIISLAQSAGTNFHAIFETANRAYDRIIILSDMQGWIGYNTPSRTFHSYRSRHRCNPTVYSFDLAGYGTLQFPERNVYALAGFSEKVFDVMKLLESDRQALIHEIEKIEL